MKNNSILHLLREDQKNNPDQSQAMLSGYAADKIELLLSSIDNLLEDIDADHQPEWASEEARLAGKDPWCCVTCGPADGSWPCVHRMALNELKAVRNG